MRTEPRTAIVAWVCGAMLLIGGGSASAQAGRVRQAEQELGGDRFWAAYSLERPEPELFVCCAGPDGHGGTFHGDRGEQRLRPGETCKLDAKQYGWGVRNGVEGGALRLFVRFEGGQAVDFAAFSETCPLQLPDQQVVSWGAVAPAESTRWLEGWLESGRLKERGADRALLALAHHPGPQATGLLERWAREAYRQPLRSSAIFWLGEARGESGLAALNRLLDTDLPGDDREQIAFALSISDAAAATQRLIRMARYEERASVRGQALFWMSQVAGQRMAEMLLDAVDEDPELEVKKKAVFGLSQLPDDEGLPLLIRLVESHPHPQVRKEALFWIGQSDRPEALDFLEAVLKRG